MNTFVVDSLIVEKALSTDVDIFTNVLCKFFQNDTPFRLCIDKEDNILNDYKKINNSEIWINIIAGNMRRVVAVSISNMTNIYLDVAEKTCNKKLITSNKQTYLSFSETRAKKVKLMDEYEAEIELKTPTQIITQVSNGNNNQNTLIQ